MNFWRKINPHSVVLEEIESSFNCKIQVIESFGERKIMAGGLIQSGGILGNIWEKGLKAIFPASPAGGNFQLPIFNVLILGLGGGTVAQLVAKRWPQAKMMGIEIDPVMIQLGRKYFGLDELKNLEIIQADAIEWVNNARCHPEAKPKDLPCIGDETDIGKKFFADTQNDNKSYKFDLILVDLYQGDKVTPGVEKEQSLKSLKRILKPGGGIIFNRLFYNHHREITEKFVKKLEKLFKITLIRAWSNLLILAHPSS